MSLTAHDPCCAITRTGDIRAWCDCGAQEGLTAYAKAFAAGRAFERKQILARLRYGAEEFENLSDGNDAWGLVADMIAEEADIIETGDYYV